MKKTIVQSGLLLALAVNALSPTLAFAQTAMEHGKMDMTKMPALTDGEVRRLDLANGKVTLKHADIEHMDMPGMTMVFTVKDKALLTGLKVGDKVKFMAEHTNGQMLVTSIQITP